MQDIVIKVYEMCLSSPFCQEGYMVNLTKYARVALALIPLNSKQ